jgi:hypothetical protein
MMAIDVLTSMAFWVWVSIWVTMLYVCGSCQFWNKMLCLESRYRKHAISMDSSSRDVSIRAFMDIEIFFHFVTGRG